MDDNVKCCECGCEGIVKSGNRFLYNHHHRGMKQSVESNRKRSKTQKGRPWSANRKRTRKEHRPNCVCTVCKAKRGELKGENAVNFGRYHSEESDRRRSETLKKRRGHDSDCRCPWCNAKRGNHPNWKGGLSRFPYPLGFNEKLKELIRERDDYICQLCGVTQKDNGRKLDVHHIDYNKENLNPRNLMSLCKCCNTKVNYGRKHWVSFFKKRLKVRVRI